ncbi:uncharacterized protein [Elaeis guineensis]|uniref:Uncharacterized protein LOC109506328 n=1 Tax=Elaeis guineensis var. tenera TaxID=51953 RepID=A0A6J0PND8_ELAGV|nr:uncharacterized protein LOC109506328 [Elaeis guineensis]
MKPDTNVQDNWWILHVDGVSNSQESSIGLIVANPDRVIVEYALRFDFNATNNVVEYEALIAGLRIIRKLDAEKVKVFFDSQLIMNQVQGEYEAKDLRIARYLNKIKDLSQDFKKIDIQRIPKSENAQTDALSHLATSNVADMG